MKKSLKSVVFASSVLIPSLSFGQTYSVFFSEGDFVDSNGVVLDHSAQDAQGINFFYGESLLQISEMRDLFGDPLAPTPEEVGALAGIDWNPLPQGVFSGIEFWSQSGDENFAGSPVDRITPGARVVVAAMSSASPADIQVGDQFGLLAANAALPDLGQQNLDINLFTVISGTSGSLQFTTVVPEPSSFAMISGAFALVAVAFRRRLC